MDPPCYVPRPLSQLDKLSPNVCSLCQTVANAIMWQPYGMSCFSVDPIDHELQLFVFVSLSRTMDCCLAIGVFGHLMPNLPFTITCS